MKPNGKKTWIDPLVEMANKGQAKDQKKLRGILRAIARFKNTRIPKRIVDELERVNKKVRFIWLGAGEPIIPAADFMRKELYSIKIDKAHYPISLDYEENKDTGEEQFVIRPAKSLDGHIRELIPPHLGSWQPLSKYDHYLFDLIPRLRDPDWVQALRVCSGPKCKRLIMSSAKWEHKFCSGACKNRFWGQKNRDRDRRDAPKGKSEKIRRVCLKCDRSFWASGKFNRICPACAEKNNKGG